MATPVTTHYKNDRRYGDSDPDGNLDTWNRHSKYVWGNFTAYDTEYGSGTGEHDRDGDHMADLLALFHYAEPVTWTGNGADDRDISTVGTFTVKYVRVWEASTTGTWFRSSDMTGDSTMSTLNTGELTDYIQSVGSSTFQVGTALNVGSRVYYAMVFGE